MSWQDITLDASAEDVRQRILGALGDALGVDYEVVDGAPEVAIVEAIADEEYNTQQAAVAASQTAAALGFGMGIIGYPPYVANAATLPGVELALLLPTSAGDGVHPTTASVVIPAGFTIASVNQAFSLPAAVSELVTFSIISTGPNAGLYGGTMTVTFTALTPGADGNIGAGTPVTVNSTANVAVTGATLTANATGGTDSESETQYLTRLVNYVATLRPGGVRASECATLAATISGVERSLAVDLFDPAHPGTPTERTVTIIPIDATGSPIPSGTKTEVINYLDSIREVNFVFNVIDPTYTNLAIVVDVTAAAGADHTAVNTAVTAAVTALINPALWGTVGGDPTTWAERSTISILDVAAVVGPIAGVASISTITINGGASAVTLTGYHGLLPAAIGGSGSSVSVTVS